MKDRYDYLASILSILVATGALSMSFFVATSYLDVTLREVGAVAFGAYGVAMLNVAVDLLPEDEPETTDEDLDPWENP